MPEGFGEQYQRPGEQGSDVTQPEPSIHGWIKVATGDDKALHGFDVEAKAEHHGHVYGRYDARTHTVLSMDGRIPVTDVRPADGGFRATAEYAADLQQGDDTHRFHAGLERIIGPFS